MLLAQITPDWCSLSLILLLLNVPLFLFGLKRQGVQFTITPCIPCSFTPSARG